MVKKSLFLTAKRRLVFVILELASESLLEILLLHLVASSKLALLIRQKFVHFCLC